MKSISPILNKTVDKLFQEELDSIILYPIDFIYQPRCINIYINNKNLNVQI